MPPIECAAKERQCVRRHRSEERARAGITREPGLLEGALSSADYRSGEREFQTLPFHLILKIMTFLERDVRKMIAEIMATRERVHERIRVRELAASHRLERMRRLRMLEEQEA